MDALREIVLPSLAEIGIPGPTAETPLLGAKASIDSLTLVAAVFACERRIEALGKKVRLVPDRPLSKGSPFRNAASLAEYIEDIVSRPHGGTA